jgi:hypothetical protein
MDRQAQTIHQQKINLINHSRMPRNHLTLLGLSKKRIFDENAPFRCLFPLIRPANSLNARADSHRWTLLSRFRGILRTKRDVVRLALA